MPPPPGYFFRPLKINIFYLVLANKPPFSMDKSHSDTVHLNENKFASKAQLPPFIWVRGQENFNIYKGQIMTDISSIGGAISSQSAELARTQQQQRTQAEASQAASDDGNDTENDSDSDDGGSVTATRGQNLNITA